MVDEPTEEDRLGFVRSYGVEPVDVNTDLTFKDAATAVAEMTPIIGDAMAAKEVYDELMKDDPNYGLIAALGGAALIGAVPGIGDAAAAGIRKAVDVAKRVEVDPDAVGMMGGNIRLKPKDESVWSYPEQLYDSADTSINVSKKPAGYNELKKRGEIKDGDVIVDIGGGRFDNLVEDAAEEGATVKVYDPFNRTPEHNAAVVDSVKDGQADMAMSHNVLNVIQEDKNIIDIAMQAENAIKPNGKAHFSVYEGDGKGVGKVTTKGYQRNEKTQAYVPLIEQVFGKDNVTKRGKIITATKRVKGFNEGGMAMEKQMEMNFSLGGIPENTIGQDPVSGNDIPLGSTAENVRDDIPANLSEGEIVVPADVVNFHGVKLFEDLRAEAKIGYAQMAEDGRIGGSPLPTTTPNMADIDIELTLEDLEASEDMGEEEDNTVEMNRGGMNFERGRGNMYSSYSAPKAPTRDRSMSAVVSRAQANRDKPKNRFEAIKQQFDNLFRDDDRRPTLTKKPPKSDDVRPSIAQQINFGGDYKDKEEPKPQPKKKKNPVTGAGGVRQAYTGDTEPMNVRYYDKGFFERLKENLGFDDGGLIGGEDQFNQPPFTTTGTGTGLVEMREYMNDAGHRIFITFIDGVPQTEIPEGYYPVGGTGSTVVMNPADIPSNQVSGGSSDGGGGGTYMPTPDGVNYRELTAEELSDMVKGQSDLKGDVITAGLGMLNPIMGLAVKFALWNQTRQVKKEIERRIVSDETTEVDKMRYQNLLELANREEPTLLDRILGRDFEKTVEQIPKPVEPDVDYSDPTLAPDQGIEAPYTPDVQTESQVTTPGVDGGYPSTFDDETRTKIRQASADAASAAFGTPSKTVEPTGQDKFIQSVKDDPSSFLPPTRSPDRSSANNQSAADEAMGRPTSRTPTREEQMMVQGINKGARVTKKRKKKKSK